MRRGKEVQSSHLGKLESEWTGETPCDQPATVNAVPEEGAGIQTAVLCLFPAPFSSMRAGEDKTRVGFDSSRVVQVSKPKREAGRGQRKEHIPSSDNKDWLQSFTWVRGERRVRLRERACACQDGQRVGRTD